MKLKLLTALFLISFTVYAQKNAAGIEFLVKKAKETIKIDGELTEESWQSSQKGKDFWVARPIDSIAPTNPTFFYITFDDDFLYVGFECMSEAREPIVESLRRDFDYGPNDNVGIYLNTYNDFTNGFYFNITPYGVQREGTVANAGISDGDYSSFWDNKWYSAVKRYEDKWVAEIAIPFKSIRYNIDEWNFNVLRNDVARNQVSSWIATPVQYMPASFQNTGRIIWEQPLPKPGMNVSLIPYLTTEANKAATEPSDYGLNFGFDAKIGVTPSLNLDLTVNPDFSNVEVDRQVINLTRFEVNFPERRQFFLENTDLFSTPGFGETRPFFSRRIGLAQDTLGNLAKVPIVYGARLSGKLGPGWRIGVMNLQTREEKKLGLPDQNYTVAVVQRQIFKRSNFDLVFINKQSLGLDKYDSNRYYNTSVLRNKVENGDTTLTFNKYNRVIGGDFNLFTKTNRWNSDVYFFKSLDNFTESDNYAFGAFVGYFSRNLTVYAGHENLGKNYNAESGYVPLMQVYPGYANGFFRVENPIYPKSTRIINFRPSYGYNFTMTPDGKVTDQTFSADFGMSFSNTSGLGISYSRIFQVLPGSFNPLFPKQEIAFQSGEEYTWYELAFGFNSDTRKLFNWDAGVLYGTYYSGERVNVNAALRYRVQPFGSIALSADYNDIKLGQPYGSAVFVLLSPRLDFTFTDKLFLTTFVQYNSRFDNINLNARFQWRFKPASDFFVVYTENYFPEGLLSKNRALVLKLTYWFNL
ncbi:hypothetical protein SanaruYs_17850 [Chryseotalea sanaruensis]|uniref:DUF5916 domain-containing protein n=1 Tax=Chryseotalea sanaruensis TaxID=2482724 RepID=A0A401U9K6_9BACT|nr:DUF5916 domain-containing protein [Chryseotalea sanaruensis]GCC51560.1 hypothetical protein SanaruYs_17850 [Chryseotalea sanaruensis]